MDARGRATGPKLVRVISCTFGLIAMTPMFCAVWRPTFANRKLFPQAQFSRSRSIADRGIWSIRHAARSRDLNGADVNRHQRGSRLATLIVDKHLKRDRLLGQSFCLTRPCPRLPVPV